MMKLFICTHPGCTYGTNQQNNLKKHIRIHTGELPFECEYCDKAYSDGSHWIEHMRSHRENPFICIKAGCGQAFNNSIGRMIHEKQVHKLAEKRMQRKYNVNLLIFSSRPKQSQNVALPIK